MQLLVNGIGMYPPGGRVGPARWAHHDLLVLLAGTLRVDAGATCHTLRAHDALLIPPRLPFSGTIGDAGGETWVQHFSTRASELPSALRSTTSPMLLRGAASSDLSLALMRRIHALRESDPSSTDRTLGEALLKCLLLEFDRAARTTNTVSPHAGSIQRAIAWAEANLGAATTLQVVAQQSGLSESHFRDLFRQLRAQSVGAWLRERRMTEARRLLSSTDLTLKEISSTLGFGDPVSFNRSFARFHGEPPGAYRRSHPRPV
jgi:AraC-like DNA-binding protein